MTTAGVIVTVPIGIPRPARKLERLVVAYSSGDLASFTTEWSTDSLVTDPTKTILTSTGGSTTVALDQLAPYAEGFAWDSPHSNGNIYVKIVPNAGVNNAFNVAAYLEE